MEPPPDCRHYNPLHRQMTSQTDCLRRLNHYPSRIPRLPVRRRYRTDQARRVQFPPYPQVALQAPLTLLEFQPVKGVHK